MNILNFVLRFFGIVFLILIGLVSIGPYLGYYTEYGFEVSSKDVDHRDHGLKLYVHYYFNPRGSK